MNIEFFYTRRSEIQFWDVIVIGFARDDYVFGIIDYVISFEEGIFFLYENLENVNCHYHFDTHEFTRNYIFSLCQLIQLLDCHQHSINRNKKSGFCCTLPLYFYASRLNQRHFCLALYMIFYICTFFELNFSTCKICIH